MENLVGNTFEVKDPEKIKSAMEAMRLLSDHFKAAAETLSAASDMAEKAAGSGATGEAFLKQYKEAAGPTIEAARGFAGAVAGTADRMGDLEKILVKTESNATTEAKHLSHATPKRH